MIIFNPETGSLVKWLDHSFKSRIRYRYDLDETKIKTKVRKLKLRNLLTQKDELISEIGVDMVGIRRNKAVAKNIQKHVTEHTVNYILDYFQEKQITPGTWVQVNPEGIKNKDTVSSQQLAEIKDRLLGEHASLVELGLINIPLLTQDMPSIPRIAFDIEVKSPRDIFPVPDKAEFQVHTAAAYDNSGRAIQYILGLSPSADEKRQIELNLLLLFLTQTPSPMFSTQSPYALNNPITSLGVGDYYLTNGMVKGILVMYVDIFTIYLTVQVIKGSKRAIRVVKLLRRLGVLLLGLLILLSIAFVMSPPPVVNG